MSPIFKTRSLFVVLLPAAVALPCSTDYLIWIPRSPTADPLYRFEKGDKIGYIDQNGRVVLAPTVKNWGTNGGGEFHDGLLESAVNDGVYVDTTGEKVIANGLYRGWDFSEGLAVAMRKGEEKWVTSARPESLSSRHVLPLPRTGTSGPSRRVRQNRSLW
jgi:hypothetical protein